MASKPDILVLSDWFAPGYRAGGPIRSLVNLIDGLEEGYEFHVVTQNKDWHAPERYAVKPNLWLQRKNHRVLYLDRPNVYNVIREIYRFRNDGIILFNGLYSPVFHALPLLWMLLFSRHRKLIVSPRGMLNQNAIALKSMKKKLLIKLLSMLKMDEKVTFHATSGEEGEAILQVFPKAKVKVATNFPKIPTQHFQKSTARSGIVVSVGRISAVKNTDVLLSFWSGVTRAKLHLVGSADDSDYLSECRKLAESCQSTPVFRGALNPEETTQALLEADFLILVTSGENFGHAIIESLAVGTPVIISDQTPWNDVEELGAGWVIAVSNEARWRSVIHDALALDEEAYRQMSKRAMTYVQNKFNFDEIRRQYIDLFEEDNRFKNV